MKEIWTDANNVVVYVKGSRRNRTHGLCLAEVRSLADALSGTVTKADGTTFTLPICPQEDDGTNVGEMRKLMNHKAGQWTITADHAADPEFDKSAVGTVGPSGATMTADEILAHKDSKRFQMRDDDGILYYEGKCYLSAGFTTSAFAPLDDFGGPNAGCTSIWYRNDADTDWETL